MSTEYISDLKVDNYENYLQSLERACKWLGVSNGRAFEYEELVRELFKDGKDSREHILAYNESCEITDIFEFWESHVSHFPGIKEKIKKCLKKGPSLREDENPNEATNRPRNDAFVFLLAGELMRANIKVIAVEGIVALGTSCHKDADITFEWSESVIDIQCKRLQTEAALEKRVRKARKQLTSPSRQGQSGIIAIDCSVLIRPPGTVVGSNSAESTVPYIYKLLEEEIKPKVNRHIDPNILGYLLFARVPAMTPTKISPILSPKGNPYINFRSDSSFSSLFISNLSSSETEIFRAIYEKIGTTINNTAS